MSDFYMLDPVTHDLHKLHRNTSFYYTSWDIALCRYCVFYKQKICSNSELSESIGNIFPMALAHFVSHFGYFSCNISKFLLF